jgi:endonuclease YncB( thermonuclease family)
MIPQIYNYKCKLIRIVDGDTIEAMIDLGFDTWTKRFIDLSGVNAPEIRTKDLDEKRRGFEAKDRLAEWLGDTFYLTSDVYDAFGRSKGTIVCTNGYIINEIVVRQSQEQ